MIIFYYLIKLLTAKILSQINDRRKYVSVKAWQFKP